MSSLDKRPSLIPQAKGYKGLGRNPNSKIPENKGYSGLGKSPEAQINAQIKQIDKKLAEEAKRLGQEPPPSIAPKGAEMTIDEKIEAVKNARASFLDNKDAGAEGAGGGDMTLDQKLEALRNAKSSYAERSSEELSNRPSAPPAEEPSEAPSKLQFRITTEVVEEKPERPELVDDTTVVEKNTDYKGPFCGQYSLSDGTRYLMGGVVSGGESNVTVDNIELYSVGSAFPDDGTFLWLDVSFDAYMEDGVLLAGGDVTSVSVSSGTTVPDNVLPTALSPTGSVMVVLGVWLQGIFHPSSCGNIYVNHCLGSLTYSRII